MAPWIVWLLQGMLLYRALVARVLLYSDCASPTPNTDELDLSRRAWYRRTSEKHFRDRCCTVPRFHVRKWANPMSRFIGIHHLPADLRDPFATRDAPSLRYSRLLLRRRRLRRLLLCLLLSMLHRHTDGSSHAPRSVRLLRGEWPPSNRINSLQRCSLLVVFSLGFSISLAALLCDSRSIKLCIGDFAAIFDKRIHRSLVRMVKREEREKSRNLSITIF